MPRCDASLDGIKHSERQMEKHQSITREWTAWIINVDGTGNKEAIWTRALVPCFPQRPLPLAVKVERDRSMCE